MSYKLTPKGEVTALHANANDPEGAVIVYLYEHGRAGELVDIDELVGELNSSETKILKIVNRLLNEENPLIKEV